jgi:hypothetical protein
VPQPTALPRAPEQKLYCLEFAYCFVGLQLDRVVLFDMYISQQSVAWFQFTDCEASFIGGSMLNFMHSCDGVFHFCGYHSSHPMNMCTQMAFVTHLEEQSGVICEAVLSH